MELSWIKQPEISIYSLSYSRSIDLADRKIGAVGCQHLSGGKLEESILFGFLHWAMTLVMKDADTCLCKLEENPHWICV